ncbi:hypothetical protein HN924_00285 [Candidatus Woesearchaeota archaeon]|jgi:hypothetical protein|nr:hypothetical protein [Candidatus Woesearchaeota archaeon]MBT7062389.1 hypothetical protein [Candidatus Woesearchaeota archaeon]MBT7402546.1 hypothetical protein [Candidatus Woesearchaeota archaeon]
MGWLGRLRKKEVQVEQQIENPMKKGNPMNFDQILVAFKKMSTLIDDEYTLENSELNIDAAKKVKIKELLELGNKERKLLLDILARVNTKRVYYKQVMSDLMRGHETMGKTTNPTHPTVIANRKRYMEQMQGIIVETAQLQKLAYSEAREDSVLSDILKEERELMVSILNMNRKQETEALSLRKVLKTEA